MLLDGIGVLENKQDGILLLDRIGIDKNQKEGAQYIKRDANLGHPKAMLMYSEGTGVERDGI